MLNIAYGDGFECISMKTLPVINGNNLVDMRILIGMNMKNDVPYLLIHFYHS